MTEGLDEALLGHVIELKGAVAEVGFLAAQTLEQAKRTNGRVNDLEAWRDTHDHRIEVGEAHMAGEREAHAQHAERHRKRRAMFTGTLSWAFDNWQALAWVAGGIGVMALARWMP